MAGPQIYKNQMINVLAVLTERHKLGTARGCLLFWPHCCNIFFFFNHLLPRRFFHYADV